MWDLCLGELSSCFLGFDDFAFLLPVLLGQRSTLIILSARANKGARLGSMDNMRRFQFAGIGSINPRSMCATLSDPHSRPTSKSYQRLTPPASCWMLREQGANTTIVSDNLGQVENQWHNLSLLALVASTVWQLLCGHRASGRSSHGRTSARNCCRDDSVFLSPKPRRSIWYLKQQQQCRVMSR
jgi:hypothetical protein